MQTEQVISEITCEQFKHRAKRREHDETFALLPSLLQGLHLDRHRVVSFRRSVNNPGLVGQPKNLPVPRIE